MSHHGLLLGASSKKQRAGLARVVLVLAMLISPLAVAEEASATVTAAPVVSASPAIPVEVMAAPANNPDPWEKFNRAIFKFNDGADRYVLRPVAKGYRAITPNAVRTGITNFFVNLRSPIVVLNDVLQGKVKQAGSDTARFVVNTTVGIVGFFDVAVHWHMPAHNEDFGLTLGKWGVGPGPYLMLPLLGPSTVRDTGGFVVDALSNPRRYFLDTDVDLALTALDVVNSRANLLDLDSIVQGDRYLFIRDLYLQSREFSVKDGQVSDPFLDDDQSEDDSSGSDATNAPESSAPASGTSSAPEDKTPGLEPPVRPPVPSPAQPSAPDDTSSPQALHAPETDQLFGLHTAPAPWFMPFRLA
jgi:phospholipid-binding lipoprotein MlaA